MFKSFFPKSGAFFLSAFVWALIAVIGDAANLLI